MALPRVRHNGDCVFGRPPDLLQFSHDPHIRFRKLVLPNHILGRFFTSQEERNVLGVRTQEESFLATSFLYRLARPHCDPWLHNHRRWDRIG